MNWKNRRMKEEETAVEAVVFWALVDRRWTRSSNAYLWRTLCARLSFRLTPLQVGDVSPSFLFFLLSTLNVDHHFPPVSDKVWSNLLLDFTKSFAEYQVPYNGFASNDFDLLLDILNIAMKNLESSVVSEQVFASRLLLNINELLNGQLIREKVMPVLKKVLDALLLQPPPTSFSALQGSTSSSAVHHHPQEEVVEEEDENASSTISLRFNLCFVLAHFAQRLE